MNQDQYTEIITQLTQLNERQFTLFRSMKRIDSHLAKINSKVENHEKDIIEIQTYGAIGLLVLPIIVNLIMRIV